MKYPTAHNKYLDYFNNMEIGWEIEVSKAKDPAGLVTAAKDCIDIGCPIIIIGEWERIKRVRWEPFESSDGK